MGRLFRTDYWLWGLLTLSFGIALVLVQYRLFPWKSWLGELLNWVDRDFEDADFVVVHLVLTGHVRFLIPAAVLAWVVQAPLLRCGICFSGRMDPAHAADYSDADPSIEA